MKIVITGAEGFIGSHLAPALVGAGHLVTRITQPGAIISGSSSRSVPADIVSGEGLSAAFDDIDGVIHLAARNHVLKETEKDPLAAYRNVNVVGTRNVIRAAARAGARWFIHFSTVKVIGESGDEIFDEGSPCHPKSPYGISKLESEEVVWRIVEERSLRAVIFRLPMAYGPRNLGNMQRMIRWADSGLPFPLVRPENLRSMVYVGNVVHGVLCAIEKSLPGISTFILKDAEDYSTRILYSTICRELGKTPCFITVPSWMVRLGGALSEDILKITGSFRVSSLKAQMELGYSPPLSFEQGIAETVEWYRRLTQ